MYWKGAIVNAGQRFVGSLHFIWAQLLGNKYVNTYKNVSEDTDKLLSLGENGVTLAFIITLPVFMITIEGFKWQYH